MPKGRKTQNSRKFPPEILSEDEIELIFRTFSNRAPTGIRNKALLYVGYRGGLRLKEALTLFPKDVDTRAGIVNVLYGKGNRSRIVGLPNDACLAIDAWLAKRARLGFTGRQPLFCSLRGGPIDSSYVRAMMKRLQKRTAIEKRLHYHQLRHTCAWRMMKKGRDLATIQRMLGHSSLATTSVYLRHVAPLDVIEAMQDP